MKTWALLVLVLVALVGCGETYTTAEALALGGLGGAHDGSAGAPEVDPSGGAGAEASGGDASGGATATGGTLATGGAATSGGSGGTVETSGGSSSTGGGVALPACAPAFDCSKPHDAGDVVSSSGRNWTCTDAAADGSGCNGCISECAPGAPNPEACWSSKPWRDEGACL